MSKERIGKLEALLERIRANASAPRAVAAASAAVAMPTAMPTVPPSAEAREKMRSESSEFEAVPPPAPPSPPPPPQAPAPPLESRARLVSEPPMELDEEEVEVLEEQPIAEVAVAAAAPPAAPERIEEPPPSSRRPIAEPAESPQEAQLLVAPQPPLTPPPESGKQVAAEALSFDDDFTGVRESAARLQKAPPEPSIPLQSLREPSPPPPPHELEAEIPRAQPEAVFMPEAAPEVARGEETRPPPGPVALPRTEKPAAPVVQEVTRPTTPVAASEVASMVGTAQAFSPKTFGELLEASLSL